MNIRHGEQSAVPSGLIAVANPNPNAEALGYYHSSLRDDEIEILVAWDASSACWERHQIRADEASALLTTLPESEVYVVGVSSEWHRRAVSSRWRWGGN